MKNLAEAILEDSEIPGEKFIGGYALIALVYSVTPEGVTPTTVYRAQEGQPWYLTEALLEQGLDWLEDGEEDV